MYQEQRPYLWARDMPVVLAQKIVDHYEKDYHIFQVTKPASEILDGVEAIKDPMTNMELVSLLLHSEKRLLIDSCMQHAAAALKMPSVVCGMVQVQMFLDGICIQIYRQRNLRSLSYLTVYCLTLTLLVRKQSIHM